MAVTGRPKVELVVTDIERAELERLTNRARVNRSLAFRAKLVLACANGQSNSAVAQAHRTTNQTVGKWRRRFVEDRLDGLYDEPRVGAPRKFSDVAAGLRGYHFHRNHRYPGTHPVARRRFSARPGRASEARGPRHLLGRRAGLRVPARAGGAVRLCSAGSPFRLGRRSQTAR